MTPKKNGKKYTASILKIEQWDTELPIGSWNGPDPLPLFPKFEQTKDLRELHIHFYPDSEQHLKIKNWMNQNIPTSVKWIFNAMDFYHPQRQKIFFALPSVHILQSKQNSEFRNKHPEIYKGDWDEQLDSCRARFLKYLGEINCSFRYVTENEALDNGTLIMKDYKRPEIISSHDSFPGISTPPKKLWRYFTLTKFVNMLQNQAIWFSRPQFFEDPHEFTMDESSQRELFQWKLDSFAREYNRAIVSNKKSFLMASIPLLTGIPTDKSGKIEKSLINLSDCKRFIKPLYQ